MFRPGVLCSRLRSVKHARRGGVVTSSATRGPSSLPVSSADEAVHVHVLPVRHLGEELADAVLVLAGRGEVLVIHPGQSGGEVRPGPALVRELYLHLVIRT